MCAHAGVPAPRKEIAVQKLDLSKEHGSPRSMSGIKAGQRLYASALTALERQRTFTSQYIQVLQHIPAHRFMSMHDKHEGQQAPLTDHNDTYNIPRDFRTM